VDWNDFYVVVRHVACRVGDAMSYDRDEYNARKPVVTRSADPTYVRLSDGMELQLQRELETLLHKAHMLGYVITVDLKSVEPLAMGKYQMVGHVRGMRL